MIGCERLCPYCRETWVMAFDNKGYCFSCRRRFNLLEIKRKYLRW
jgi:hypothetical protein